MRGAHESLPRVGHGQPRDQIARLLLGEYGGFDLEITTADLESAFIDLTGPSAMGAAK